MIGSTTVRFVATTRRALIGVEIHELSLIGIQSLAAHITVLSFCLLLNSDGLFTRNTRLQSKETVFIKTACPRNLSSVLLTNSGTLFAHNAAASCKKFSKSTVQKFVDMRPLQVKVSLAVLWITAAHDQNAKQCSLESPVSFLKFYTVYKLQPKHF